MDALPSTYLRVLLWNTPRLAVFMKRINVVYNHKPTLFGTKI